MTVGLDGLSSAQLASCRAAGRRLGGRGGQRRHRWAGGWRAGEVRQTAAPERCANGRRTVLGETLCVGVGAGRASACAFWCVFVRWSGRARPQDMEDFAAKLERLHREEDLEVLWRCFLRALAAEDAIDLDVWSQEAAARTEDRWGRRSPARPPTALVEGLHLRGPWRRRSLWGRRRPWHRHRLSRRRPWHRRTPWRQRSPWRRRRP